MDTSKCQESPGKNRLLPHWMQAEKFQDKIAKIDGVRHNDNGTPMVIVGKKKDTEGSSGKSNIRKDAYCNSSRRALREFKHCWGWAIGSIEDHFVQGKSAKKCCS